MLRPIAVIPCDCVCSAAGFLKKGYVVRSISFAAGVLFALASFGSAFAQAPSGGGPTPSPPGAAVYFIDLKNGATLPPKSIIHFGLRGMGVAPAGSDRENSGHHHLLVDTELPPLDQPIPNDFNHLHFGAGQTESEISLPPGEHTLQLLLGDKSHVPHSPPVMSERITVRVVDPADAQAASRTPSPPGAAVYFVDVKNGATLPPKALIHFGLTGMGVAPAGSDRENSGHHHLLIDTELPPLDKPIPNDFNHLHFGAGQTEAVLDLPPGEHTLQLLLGDKGHIPHVPPVMSDRITVRVLDPAEAATPRLTPSPPGAAVYFVDVKNGATIAPKALIHFGLTGMGVAPAGSDRENSGHHHLLIDTELPPLDKPIPNDFNHLHFGAGQTEATIDLPPGEHTLQLLLGDRNHVPHSPAVMSERVTVRVVDPAQAQAGPRVLTPSPPGAAAYFVDLKNGATLPAKSVVHFGLHDMGVAPAGSNRENSGHHHLLIDTELPPLDQPIPNDFNHLHFGAGQTEAELNLPPGEHTLQLLLGDKDHVPHSPPVMSDRITVRVLEEGAAQAAVKQRHPSPPGAKVYFVYPADGSYLLPTVNIRFGLVNMGVAPAGVEKPNTGHHHLLIDAPLPPFDQPIPNDFNHLHFGAGQTEAQVTLPLGEHTLQLLLGDENHLAHEPPVYSKPLKIVVVASFPRRPVAAVVHRHRR